MKYRSIVLSVAIHSILCACSRGAFIIDGNSRVTVSVGIDDPVVGTALEIFSGDISNVLSATCSEAGRDAYEAGLEVPDDVTLMWCDDNYGYIRHFPTQQERERAGGNGIYYHVSYWGRPHDYLWLGTFSPALLYQQMGLRHRQEG